MIVNQDDLTTDKDGSFKLKAVCYQCQQDLDIQLSHFHDNEILVIPHNCPTVSKPDAKGISE